MKSFQNILFVSSNVDDEGSALKQALSLARNNEASLKVLIVCRPLPSIVAEYAPTYEDILVSQMVNLIEETCAALKITKGDVPIKIEIEAGEAPSVRIIRRVLRDGHDLVIKQAEFTESGKGFKSVDMGLLRKCPCAVWLARPIEAHRQDIHVAVAIDPEGEEKGDQGIALSLLEVSRALADSCSGVLNIISCWDFEFEEYLRHNVWIKISEADLKKAVTETQNNHRRELDRVIERSSVGGEIYVHHVRGRPDVAISHAIEGKAIDVLVMGTVARTGISGFIFGNTAENIVQKLGCSVLALKPSGFVSPVKEQ